MNYEYILEVHDVDSDARVAKISAYSESDLLEQLHKVDHGIAEYERTHARCYVCGERTEEKHPIREGSDDPTGHEEYVCRDCWKHIEENNQP